MNEDKSARYQRLKRNVFWLGLVCYVVGAFVLLPGGGAVALREAIVRATGAPATSLFAVAVLSAAVVLMAEAVGLPITIYKKRLERRYGLPHLSVRREVLDDIKGLPLGMALVAGHAVVTYFLLSRFPVWWWLLAALAFAAGVAALTVLAPLVTPLAYRCRPLHHADLKNRLGTLASKAGVEGLEVFEWLSDTGTRRLNAALVGTGRGRRVLLSDRLLSDYSHDEIEVIVAHELGHHVHGDIRFGLLLRALQLVTGFGAAAFALDLFWRPLHLVAPHDAAGIPLLLLVAGLTALIPRPLLNAVSRRKEYRADRFALDLTRRPDAFVSALRRLRAQTLAEERPSTMTVWLFHSHPTVDERIQAARAFF